MGPWLTIEEARAAGVPEEAINEALLEADEAVYGVRITDVTGKRIDPLRVKPGASREPTA